MLTSELTTKEMKKTAQLLTLLTSLGMSAVFFVPIAQAQTPGGHFVLVDQGRVSSTTAPFSSSLNWSVNIGTGFSGTTTSAFVSETITTTAPNAQWSRVDISGFSDPGYTIGVSTCTYDSEDEPAGSYSGFVQLTHLFQETNNGCVFSPNLYYNVEVSDFAPAGGASSMTVDGVQGWSLPPGYSIVSAAYSPFFSYFSIVADGFQITPTASSTGLFLSGAQEFCNAQFGTTTAGIFGIGTDIANGFCQAAGYLFVPTPQSIQQFQGLQSALSQAVPFSYVYEFFNDFDSLQASTTENLQSFSISFPSIGSTTPLGAVVPTNFDILSTTTISKYYPDSAREGFLFLASMAIWFVAILSIYHRAQKAI